MSGGGSGGGTQTQTQQVILPDWLQSAAAGSLSNAQTLSQNPYQANPYATIAPMTADQTQAYEDIANLQGQSQPAYAAAEDAATGLLGSAVPVTTQQVGAGATDLMNPYTADVVAPTSALMRQQLATSLGTIGANAANVGAYGGSRQGVEEGTAVSQEALQSGQYLGGLLSSGYGQALSTSAGIAGENLQAGTAAISALPQIATAGQTAAAQQAGLLEAAGRAEQGQSQAELDTNAANFQSQILWPYEQQEVLEQALTSTPYGGTTATTGTAPTQNKALGALGGAASGAAMGSMFGPYGTAIGAVAGGLLGAFQ
jgi:hypothetical protein